MKRPPTRSLLILLAAPLIGLPVRNVSPWAAVAVALRDVTIILGRPETSVPEQRWEIR
jgi:hypothetical protein